MFFDSHPCLPLPPAANCTSYGPRSTSRPCDTPTYRQHLMRNLKTTLYHAGGCCTLHRSWSVVRGASCLARGCPLSFVLVCCRMLLSCCRGERKCKSGKSALVSGQFSQPASSLSLPLADRHTDIQTECAVLSLSATRLTVSSYRLVIITACFMKTLINSGNKCAFSTGIRTKVQ